MDLLHAFARQDAVQIVDRSKPWLKLLTHVLLMSSRIRRVGLFGDGAQEIPLAQPRLADVACNSETFSSRDAAAQEILHLADARAATRPIASV